MTEDQTAAHDTPGSEGPDSGQPDSGQTPGAQAPVGTAPVAAGPSRRRWILGLGAAGIILALAAGAFLLLGGPTTPEVLKYVPADSAAVMEVRMDLPGDQMQKLGNFLAHFPGFADQSTLSAKIDEAFAQLVNRASDGQADYMTDIKPWLNGPLFIAAGPDALQGGATSPQASPGRFLVAATTNGGVACDSIFQGQQVTHETYQGVDITLGGEMACAVDGRFGLAGDPASVRKALDTKAAGSGMQTSTRYSAARRSLQGDQLATIFLSGSDLRRAMPSPDSLPVPGLGALGGEIPDWLIMGLRAEDDAAVMDVVTAPVAQPSPGASLLTLPPVHPSILAAMAPADTLVFIEDQGTGVSLQNLLVSLRDIPGMEAPLGMLGGLASTEELVGWVQDLGIAVSLDGNGTAAPSPRVALMLVAPDATGAADKVATVRTLLSLAALGGQGIAVAQETISGVAVTTVTITDLGSLVPPGSVPDLGEIPETGDVSLSIAARDRVIYLTFGEGAMAGILGVGAGASLADDPAFKSAATRALDGSRTSIYVAAGATVDLVERFLPAEMASEWATGIAPYVGPLQAVGAWSVSDASGSRWRTVVTVAGP